MTSHSSYLPWLEQHQGFTLAELLIVVLIIGIISAVAVPMLSFQDAKKLEVAAQEVGNMLRYGMQAGQTGSYVLVDAKTLPGHIKLFTSDASGAALGTVSDAQTKRAYDIDITGGAFTTAVAVTPRFMQSGTAYKQLLIGSSGQLQVFDGPSANMGTLQAGSGVVLALGTPSITVSINEITGFVTLP